MKYLNYALILSIIFALGAVSYALAEEIVVPAPRVVPTILDSTLSNTLLSQKDRYNMMMSGVSELPDADYEALKAQYVTSFMILNRLETISKQLDQIWKKQK